MEVAVLFLDFLEPFIRFEKYMTLISNERQERIEKYVFDKDKTISLFSELLMRKLISKKIDITFSEIKFGYNSYGKPYVIDANNYNFSISHSDNCIVFVDDIYQIGIDVEHVLKNNNAIAKSFFTANEIEYLYNSGDVINAFYDIWTSKEAYVKMLGLGLTIKLNSFDVLKNMDDYNFITKKLKDFTITVCFKKRPFYDIKIKFLNKNQLMDSLL